MKIKSINIAALCAGLMLLVPAAYAIPTYTYDGATINGVSDLDIGGEIWDMQLHNGTFRTVDVLRDEPFAALASTALASFLDSYPVSDPNLLLGCTDGITVCYIETVFEKSTGLGESFKSHLAGTDGSTTLSGNTVFTGDSNTDYSNHTFATWTLQTSSVPEPGIAALLATGLAFVAVARRKVRN